MAKGGSGGTIGLSIELIFIATIGIAAVGLIINANYTNWDSTSKLMVQSVLVIVVGIAFILLVLKRVGYNVKL